MDSLPNFSNFGYQVVDTLGHNHFGGRITYLAIKNNNNSERQTSQFNPYVVIKQFQFAQSNSDWLGYKAYQREIAILKQLDHFGIPKYLDSFETDNGFCMVQEYKQASSLAIARTYSPEEIKHIAIAILEILIYLQNRVPPVIHRDLKPENILVDEQINVYLVDFGFARIGGENLAMSSVTLGTLGFMPPEQIYNRKLTPATDLYSLGMTLICLLTKTKSTEVDTLIDEDNNLNFQHLLPQLSQRWLNWLQKLVQRNPNERYVDAMDALQELKPIYIFKQPEVNLSTSNLEFIATTYGEKITKTITLTNSIAETILEGNWQVASHLSDPPHTPDRHAWISFSEQDFSGNQVKLNITVDTSQLVADKNYHRTILLNTNSYPETYKLTVNVQTPNIITANKIPYLKLISLIPLSALLSFISLSGYDKDAKLLFVFLFLGMFIGIVFLALIDNKRDINWQKILAAGIRGTLVSTGGISGILLLPNYNDNHLAIITGGVLGAALSIFNLNIINQIKQHLRTEKFTNFTIYRILAIAILLGFSIGYGFANEFYRINLLIIGTTSSLIVAMISSHIIKSSKILKKYRQSETKLIKP